METGSTHSCRISGINGHMALVIPLILLAAVPLVLISSSDTAGGFGWALLWSVFACFIASQAAWRQTRRIEVAGDDVAFVMLLRRTHTTLGRIRSISSKQGGYFTVAYDGGKVFVVGPMTGWHDFVTLVKDGNPAVELKGL